MTYKPPYIIGLFLIAFLLLISSCSNQKDGFINRAYHNTTARYNGYFYARESIKEGLALIRTAHSDDFEEILPIFIDPQSSEEASPAFSQMDRAITKSTTVIKRHSMKINGKEKCRWIDDNYLAVAKAHYFKREFKEAQNILQFGSKEFASTLLRFPFQIWLARCYISDKRLDEAGLLLSALSQDKELPEKLKGEYFKVYATYFIARQNWTKASEMLLSAIPREKKKKNRIRLQYILAQLYAKAGKANDAIRYFELVAQKSNDYNLVFNARIFQAMNVQNKVSGYRVKDQLNKMLRDDKNAEFQDQIYYALGEINYRERRYKEAINNWRQSTEVSFNNPKQKSKSFLRLANYFFGEKQYEPARVHFDSAVAVLPSNYPEAKTIKETAASLDELVDHLNTVKTQDSLLALAQLSPDELDKRLNTLCKQLQKEADDAAAAKAILDLQAASAPIKPVITTQTGDFYFYNPNALKSGAQDFQKKWGTRKLEDDWRRSNKNVVFAGFENSSTNTTDSAVGSAKTDPNRVVIKKEDLKKNIPLSLSAQNEAHNQIIESLYASGSMFKEKFKDSENAIESFSNLVLRYDTSRYQAITYYQLYRLYLQKETKKAGDFFSLDTKSSSEYYRQLILTEFPESEFARLVENPNYLKEAQANKQNELNDYARMFSLYKTGNYQQGIDSINFILADNKAGLIVPKFILLRSKMEAETGDLAKMTISLNQLAKAYTSTPEGKEAARILALLKPKESANAIDSIPPPLGGLKKAFSTQPQAEHYLCLVFPNTGLDPSVYISSINNFNASFFPSKTFDISNTFIDNDRQIIILKSFSSQNEAGEYFKKFIDDKKQLRMINIRKENAVFFISVENFITFYQLKNLEEYLSFFTQNYPL